MKDCSSCFTPWADSTIKPSTTGSQLRRLMPVTAVTFAGPQPADITGRSIPARGRGRLSLLRRRDSDAFLLARVGDVRDGGALHVALPREGNNRKKLALRSTRRNLLCPAPAGLPLGGLGPGACSSLEITNTHLIFSETASNSPASGSVTPVSSCRRATILS